MRRVLSFSVLSFLMACGGESLPEANETSTSEVKSSGPEEKSKSAPPSTIQSVQIQTIKIPFETLTPEDITAVIEADSYGFGRASASTCRLITQLIRALEAPTSAVPIEVEVTVGRELMPYVSRIFQTPKAGRTSSLLSSVRLNFIIEDEANIVPFLTELSKTWEQHPEHAPATLPSTRVTFPRFLWNGNRSAMQLLFALPAIGLSSFEYSGHIDSEEQSIFLNKLLRKVTPRLRELRLRDTDLTHIHSSVGSKSLETLVLNINQDNGPMFETVTPSMIATIFKRSPNLHKVDLYGVPLDFSNLQYLGSPHLRSLAVQGPRLSYSSGMYPKIHDGFGDVLARSTGLTNLQIWLATIPETVSAHMGSESLTNLNLMGIDGLSADAIGGIFQRSTNIKQAAFASVNTNGTFEPSGIGDQYLAKITSSTMETLVINSTMASPWGNMPAPPVVGFPDALREVFARSPKLGEIVSNYRSYRREQANLPVVTP